MLLLFSVFNSQMRDRFMAFAVEYIWLFYNQVTNRNVFRYKSFLDRVIEARKVNVEIIKDNYPLRLHPDTD